MSAPTQKAPYLDQQRQFPSDDIKALATQVDLAYINIAQKVNDRTIGIYALGASTTTGNALYLQGSNQKQQTVRQIYTFTAAGNIAHGINTANIAGFLNIYGTFTDGSSVWYPLPFTDVAGATNQIGVSVTATNIVIVAGAGAPPTISSGFVVLEWISLV